MPFFIRTAGLAVTLLSAAAAVYAAPAQDQVASPFAAPQVQPLPAEAAISEPTEFQLPTEEPAATTAPAILVDPPVGPAASLAALVSRHASDTPADREADCLARAVYFESKGEPLAGRLAVAEVVINRATSGRFPGTLCGVVKQPSQFSFYRGGAFPAVREPRQWREAVAIAHIALNDLWKGPASRALYFHAKRVSPGWNRQRVTAVGNHVFYR